jgi:hypothetical protein
MVKKPRYNAERRICRKYGGGIGKKSPPEKFQLYAKNPRSNFFSKLDPISSSYLFRHLLKGIAVYCV